MVKIDFVLEHEDQELRDCIVLPDNHGLTDEQINDIKQRRFADWIAAIQPVEGA